MQKFNFSPKNQFFCKICHQTRTEKYFRYKFTMKQQNDFTNPKSHLIPKEWPKNLIYLTNPVSNIDRVKPIEFLRDEEISLLRTHFKIKKVQIGHPCHSTKLDKGFGLFCTKKIPKNTILGEYTGETFVKPQRKMSQMHTPYALKLDEDIIINARRAGNEVCLYDML